MKKAILLSIICLCIASSSLFANGQQEEGSQQAGEKTPISFWNIYTENPDKGLATKVLDKYNSDPSKKFEMVQVPTQNDSYKEKIIIAMSSGKCPDVYFSWSGGPMNEYINSGFAQPLDDLIKESGLTSKIMPGALAQSSYKGHIYALPTASITLSGIYYNKEIFNQYGLEVPQTVQELEQVCDVLKSHGIIPFALANKSKWTGSMFFMYLATRKAGLQPFQDAAEGTGTFEDPCFIYAGQKIQEWVKKGYFPEGVNSLSEDDGMSRQLMYQEKAGMMLNGTWNSGIFLRDSKEFYNKIGWFSFPALADSTADQTIQVGSYGSFFSFNCTGEKLKDAFECIAHYYDDDIIKETVKQGEIPPTLNVADYISEPLTREVLKAASNASSVQLNYDQYLPPEVAQTHLNTCQELFGLSITPEKAAEKLEASMESYLANK